jgi:hypothetical protein
MIASTGMSAVKNIRTTRRRIYCSSIFMRFPGALAKKHEGRVSSLLYDACGDLATEGRDFSPLQVPFF